jgi:ABC-2 type transport system ATP-binding protein
VTPGSAPAVEVTGLRYAYGATVAVDGLDLSLDPGRVLGFLGPNGAGKTTVIRILSTLLRPDAGEVRVAGLPLARSAEIRRRIGVLPEGAGYPVAATGQEWLAFHGRLFGRGRREARAVARALLDEVGLSERADRAVATYSRGMRQRLGVARALVNDPRVVLLDEPTLGLDPAGQRQLLDLVVGLARGRGVAVLLSTHQLADVEEFCDEVVILHRGRRVARGPVAEVAEGGRLGDVFLALTEDAP